MLSVTGNTGFNSGAGSVGLLIDRLVLLEIDLPRQQTRQEQVAGFPEVLDLEMQLVDEADARRNYCGKLVE